LIDKICPGIIFGIETNVSVHFVVSLTCRGQTFLLFNAFCLRFLENEYQNPAHERIIVSHIKVFPAYIVSRLRNLYHSSKNLECDLAWDCTGRFTMEEGEWYDLESWWVFFLCC